MTHSLVFLSLVIGIILESIFIGKADTLCAIYFSGLGVLACYLLIKNEN